LPDAGNSKQGATGQFSACSTCQYIRAGTPEYLRLIERDTLRTYGQFATPLSAFCSLLPLIGCDAAILVLHELIWDEAVFLQQLAHDSYPHAETVEGAAAAVMDGRAGVGDCSIGVMTVAGVSMTGAA
jgi:hypothetical protein